MFRSLLRTKDLDALQAEIGESESKSGLRRSLGAVNITLLGIGAILGAGIFATVGTAAAGDVARPGAGPSLVISFMITAVVCGFTALCYAEMASMVPVSGSAYTYAYATLGELVAWIIGWDLIIEYAVGNVAVAISWANYFRSLMEDLGLHIPAWLATDFRTAGEIPGLLESAPHLFGVPIIFNVLALGIVAAITVVLVWGIRESARVNAAMVLLKVAALLFFIGAALAFSSPAQLMKNWQPFQPEGWAGTLAGAAVVFFAFIGFDAVSTVAEETRDPGRDLPIGILASLVICTLLYVAIAALFTGLVPYQELKLRPSTEQAEPLTMALEHVAPGARWARVILALGAVVAQSAVLLVFQMGQPRIFFSMARDGLLPPVFARIHPRLRTPHVTTILTGVVVGVVAAVTRIDEMVDLTNIGTLFAFVLVCAGIPILRRRDPDRARPFRVPLGPYLLPVLGMASCLGLMVYLPPASWWRFVGWLALGLAIYTAYGHARSTTGRQAGAGATPRTPPALWLACGGFLLVAVGLFTIPHQASPGDLLHLVMTPDTPEHFRSLIGLACLAVGAALGLGGLTFGTARERAA